MTTRSYQYINWRLEQLEEGELWAERLDGVTCGERCRNPATLKLSVSNIDQWPTTGQSFGSAILPIRRFTTCRTPRGPNTSSNSWGRTYSNFVPGPTREPRRPSYRGGP